MLFSRRAGSIPAALANMPSLSSTRTSLALTSIEPLTPVPFRSAWSPDQRALTPYFFIISSKPAIRRLASSGLKLWGCVTRTSAIPALYNDTQVDVKSRP